MRGFGWVKSAISFLLHSLFHSGLWIFSQQVDFSCFERLAVAKCHFSEKLIGLRDALSSPSSLVVRGTPRRARGDNLHIGSVLAFRPKNGRARLRLSVLAERSV